MPLYALIHNGTDTGRREDFADGAAPQLSPAKGMRWVPVVDNPPPFDPSTQVRQSLNSVVGDELRVVYHVRDMTPDELASRRAGLLASIRQQRDPLLAATDGKMLRYRDQIELGLPTTLTGSQYAALLTYRQALRDITETFGSNPEAVVWPSLSFG